MSAKPMNNERLAEIVREHADTLHRDEVGYWQFDYFGFQMIIMTGDTMNRMRIMSPVAPLEGMENEQLLECLAANFDRALDAKYATSGGILWSTFMHPLAELEDHQVLAALNQVARLSATFGTTYSSSDLTFG